MTVYLTGSCFRMKLWVSYISQVNKGRQISLDVPGSWNIEWKGKCSFILSWATSIFEVEKSITIKNIRKEECWRVYSCWCSVSTCQNFLSSSISVIILSVLTFFINESMPLYALSLKARSRSFIINLTCSNLPTKDSTVNNFPRR